MAACEGKAAIISLSLSFPGTLSTSSTDVSYEEKEGCEFAVEVELRVGVEDDALEEAESAVYDEAAGSFE